MAWVGARQEVHFLPVSSPPPPSDSAVLQGMGVLAKKSWAGLGMSKGILGTLGI